MINSIICADVLDGLRQIPDGVVTLVVTSPPYAAGKGVTYDNRDDNQPYSEYLKWLKDIFIESKRVLRSGGRIILNIDSVTNREADKEKEYFRPILVDLGNMMRELDMHYFGEHIWYKSGAKPNEETGDLIGGQFCGKRTSWGSYMMPSCPAIRRNHEYILLFSKGQFKLEKAPDSGDPDISAEDFQNWIASMWSMQPETRKMGGHNVPFPVELPYRCIKMYSYPNDIILDPFMGTGTTAVAAIRSNRRYIGIDNSEMYCKYARDRIAAEQKIL